MRRLRAALPVGLQCGSTAWVAGVMIVSAAAVFIVVYQDTGTQLRSQIDRNIAVQTAQLSDAVLPFSNASPAVVSSAASRYVRAQPYTASSTLLFVLTPGAAPVSNHPEVFETSAPPEPGEPRASRPRRTSPPGS